MASRNQPCFCGSGKRFKHCHGRYRTEAEPLSLERQKAILHDRQKQQGFGKAIQTYGLQKGRAVVVGRSIFVGEWVTFTDFLLTYLAERIGKQWIAAEMTTGSDGHLIGQWASAMRRAARSAPSPARSITKAKVNNGFRSTLALAYDLYLIEHHYEQYDEPLLDRMINRLRMSDGFLATLSEMHAAAAFLKAGFFLKYEDDLRPGHHAEFTAISPETGRRFSVEVKTRLGQLNAERPSIDQIKLKNKLSQALKKDLPWSRVVLVDLNLPDVTGDSINESLLSALLFQVEDAERSLKIRGQLAPSAYLFLLNQPFHHNHDSLEGASVAAAIGFRMPTFQPRPPATFQQIVLAREAHPEMHRLIESMKVHTEIPSTFDGQAPEFAFTDQSDHPRWIVGNEYAVPDASNKNVLARLVSASANAETKTMHGVFEANGANFLASCPMTDIEVDVFRRNPETFFGVLQSVDRRAQNAYELAEFFYETYKDTPREKLLEFLKDHPGLDAFRDWSQKHLAIFICEQWALGAEGSTKTRRPQEGQPNIVDPSKDTN
ncbi:MULTISPECIES: SEC-C domain-containing protein [Bradyrhizobium]|uniref:SEC-C domain-containing protein n=1 Tax=Bradyrhizobium TaxID=374 RepID=UPI0004BB3A82|nr:MULTISPECIES: SEC-C domain-containing protein [Bradyrhizobium]MCS3450136.1 hypothetical protein [Bradyrhizobium elkanii]MCS3558720.1 hypothetical protein [Bradyrhizobium elkanii]MCW2151433.1 hypothetical protein [Bradyrhizobium elkanii]MCW2358694.1 hypothetical protein [Bradyrhizobium elkanii]MCW2375164.1 hypothetical protein [Bradyrhizobium elkanii]